jgi:hypothetical protein
VTARACPRIVAVTPLCRKPLHPLTAEADHRMEVRALFEHAIALRARAAVGAR